MLLNCEGMTAKSISPVSPTAAAMRASCWPSSHTVNDLLTGHPSGVAFRQSSNTPSAPTSGAVSCAAPGHQIGQSASMHPSAADPNGMAAAMAQAQYMQNYYVQAMIHHRFQTPDPTSTAMSPIMSPHSLS